MQLGRGQSVGRLGAPWAGDVEAHNELHTSPDLQDMGHTSMKLGVLIRNSQIWGGSPVFH